MCSSNQLLRLPLAFRSLSRLTMLLLSQAVLRSIADESERVEAAAAAATLAIYLTPTHPLTSQGDM